MLTDQLLDSSSHFLRGFAAYCRDNAIPESEALLGLQKSAAVFPQVAAEFRKLAAPPIGLADEVLGLGGRVAGQADNVKPGMFGGLKNFLGFGKVTSPGASVVTPKPIAPVRVNPATTLPSTARPIVPPTSGGLVPKPASPGAVFEAPYVAPTSAAPVSPLKPPATPRLAPEGTPLSGPQTAAKPAIAVAEPPLPNPYDPDAIAAYQRAADQASPMSLKPEPVSRPRPYTPPQQPRRSWFSRKPQETDEQYVAKLQAQLTGNADESSLAVRPSSQIPQPVVTPNKITATPDVPVQPKPAPSAPVIDDAAAPAAGAAKPTGEIDDATYASAFDAANGVTLPRTWYQATKDGLRQARDVAVGNTAKQQAITAGSGVAGAAGGGYWAAQDSDSDWGDVGAGALRGALTGLSLPAAYRLARSANPFAQATGLSLPSATAAASSPIGDAVAGNRGLFGTELKPGSANSQSQLDEQGRQSQKLLASRQSDDPKVNAANQSALLERQLQETERIKGDPNRVVATVVESGRRYTGDLGDATKVHEFLTSGGAPAQIQLRNNLNTLEQQMLQAKQSGQKLDQATATQYITAQAALADHISGGKPGEAAAKAAEVLKSGVTEAEIGDILQTDAGKKAFQTYSGKFFGPNGPTADPSTILSNFLGMLQDNPQQAAALMLGIPVALFGVMSALGGEGGMGAVLATVLGGGAAAYGAGLFGGEGVSRLFAAGQPATSSDAEALAATPASNLTQAEFVNQNAEAAHAQLVQTAEQNSVEGAKAYLLKQLAPTSVELRQGTTLAAAGNKQALIAWVNQQMYKHAPRGLAGVAGQSATPESIAEGMIEAAKLPSTQKRPAA